MVERMDRCSNRRPAHRAAGFSFLWTLLLVAFLGLSATTAVEVSSTLTQREQERELLSVGRQFRAAIARYHESTVVAGQKQYPATLDALLLDDRSPGVTRHLRKVFVDPMTGKVEWGLVHIGGRIVGVHSLSEKVPIKQDGFDPEESSFRHRRRISEWVFAPAAAPPGTGVSPPPSPGTPASGIKSPAAQ